jgi:putative hemolysin
MRSYLTAMAYAVVLSGCANIPTTSTGILPAGANTYTLGERFRPMLGSVEAEQRSTLAKADDFCAQQGRKLVPSTMEPGEPGPFGPTVFTVVFQCLLPNDPAVAKYQSEQMPDVTVEQRNR